MKPLDSFTLADLRDCMGELRPDLANFANLALARTHNDFQTALYSDLDQCISKIEEDPSIRQKDCEDRLTAEIILALNMRGYNAHHDEKIGGHCDISVRYRDLPFIWLGEAKIHSDYDYLWKGFQQLCTRYAPGTPHTNSGGMIIYIRQKKAAQVISRWKEHLKSFQLEDYRDSDCASRPNLAFYTTHTHESSGLPYTTRHIGVVLHFDPQDRR